MSQPIVLWNTKRRANHSFDDAGASIHKTILAPSVSQASYSGPTNNFKLKTVPPLAYFCICALIPYPDQLHNLQHPISYSEQVVRALVPPRVISRDVQHTDDVFDVQSADPRLWATLAQVMHPLPPEFSDYEVPLSDLHLPLLQQVPSRDGFCFVTLLSLPGCNEVCDNTVTVLSRLNSLVALDLRGTVISSYGIAVLTRSLSWSCDELQTRTGPWGLRILQLHSCTNIDNEVFPALSKFPLLSSLDLRFTLCTTRIVSKHLANAGFKPSSDRTLFYPAPLEVSLNTLERLLPSQESGDCHLQSIYSCPTTSVYKLHVSKLNHREHLHRQTLSPLMHSNSCDNGSTGSSGPALRDRTTSNSYLSCQPHREYRIRAAVVDSAGVNKERLALVRPPPPWSVLDTHRPSGRQQRSHDPQGNLASIDHTRISKHHVAAVQDMVISLGVKHKRRRVESTFENKSTQPDPISKTKNPFLKPTTSTLKSNRSDGMARSVFSEKKAPAMIARPIVNSIPKFCDARTLRTITLAPSSGHTGSNPLSKFSSNSHPPGTSRSVEKTPKFSAKQLRPITSYPVPPCPKEHLLLVPQPSMVTKERIRSGLAFPRLRVHEDESDNSEDEWSTIAYGKGVPTKRARVVFGTTDEVKPCKREEKMIAHPSASTSKLANIVSVAPSKLLTAGETHPVETPTPAQRVQNPGAKPLRPITSYPVPPCPIEHLLLVPQLSKKKKKEVQTELTFARSKGYNGEMDGSDNDSRSNSKDKSARKVGVDRGDPSIRRKGKRKGAGFDWNKWRRTTI